jgi:O-antigen ligase
MLGSDTEMRVYAAWLCLGLSIYFFFQYPSAPAILGFTVIGLGPAPMFGAVHYATLVAVLQTVLAVLLAVRLILKHMAPAFFLQFRSCANLYAFCLLLIWAEILAVSFLDLNSYRAVALRASLYAHWLPLLILALALPTQGADSWCRGIFLGLAGYATAYVGLLLPIMWLDGRLQNSLLGADRLTTYLQDSINGSRMFFFGSLGFFALAVCSKGRVLSKSFLFGAAAFFFALLMLNGTKQFLLGLAAAFFLYLWRMGIASRGDFLLAAVLGLAAFFSVQHFLFDSAGVGRFDYALIEEDAVVGRGSIWREAMKAGVARPMTGMGFRNFGDEVPVFSEETGELGWVKDSAHGFFQSVTAEHGVMLAVVTFGALLALMRKGFGGLAQNQKSQIAYLCVLVALVVPENFSCSVYNAFGYHLVAFLPMILQRGAELVTVQARNPAFVTAAAA